MLMRIKPLNLCLVLAVSMALFAGDYRIKTVPVLPIESYPAKVMSGQVTIAVDPYTTDEKSFTAFDVKTLNSRGYFPIHVIIQNSSPNYISVRTRNITLTTAAGQELFTTSATNVVEDVIKGSLISKLPKMKAHDQSTSTKVGSPLFDFTSKELTNRQIDPGTVSDGFVFFYTDSQDSDYFVGSKIVIPKVVDEVSQKNFGPFIIPLDNSAPLSSTKQP